MKDAISIQRDAWLVVTLDGKRAVKIACPRCGVWAYLEGHTVDDDDGLIMPSVACECGFHANLRLVGWTSEED